MTGPGRRTLSRRTLSRRTLSRRTLSRRTFGRRKLGHRTLGHRTLSGRVSALALAVIAGWLVVLAVAFDLVLSSRINNQVHDALRVRAQAASSTVAISGGRIVGVRESATDSTLDSSIWIYRGTVAIARPHAAPEAQRAADQLARSGATEAEAADRRFLALPISAAGRRVGTVVAAVDTGPYDETEGEVVVGIAVLAVLVLVFAYPVLRLSTSRALRPVGAMTRRAADWSLTAPSQRFGSDQPYAELASLAGTLDQLLDRVAGVLRHERQLSAELSHELRTPLARVVGEIDLMIDDAQPALQDALRSMRASCLAMDTIIDTLLATARAELAPTPGHAALEPVLQSFVDTSAVPVVRAETTGLSVGIDPHVVVRTLSPIVDNARRFATTEVCLQARRSGGSIAIAITNDGPPIDPALAELAFEPGFTRGGADGHDGVGLGLSLARRLARAADGDVTVEPGAARTTFLVTLPAG